MKQLRIIIPGILKFPFEQEDEARLETSLVTSRSFISNLNRHFRKMPKKIRKEFSSQVRDSKILNKWRRSIGFMTANIINGYPKILESSNVGLAQESLSQFLKFTRSLPLINALYLSSAKTQELRAVLELVNDSRSTATGTDDDSSSDSDVVVSSLSVSSFFFLLFSFPLSRLETIWI